MQQFKTFIIKEFYHVFRDSKTLLMLFGLPIAQIVLFGFALTNEIKNSEIAICDYANDYTSNEIIDKIAHSNYFDVTTILHNQNQIEDEFKKGHIKLVIVFPNEFSNHLYHEGKANIQIIADASDPNTATTTSTYIQYIIQDYISSINKDNISPILINVAIRMLYNPELKSAMNFVPGVIALVLLLVCVLMTSVSIVKEKELGTMEILLVSPMNPIIVIISKVIPYFFLSLINLTIILLMSIFLLDLPINGSILLLYIESSIMILCALSLGLLISNSTDSQQAAMLISLMAMLIPTIMFTGFLFPLENMPLPLRIISNFIPSKWYYIIVKSIMIKGLGFGAIWKETLILVGMTLIMLAISFKNLKLG